MKDGDASRRIKGLDVAATTLVFLVLAGFIMSGDWVPLLDSANLAFHQAGHPLAGLLSERLTVYGGTLLQLPFPVLAVIHFSRNNNPTGVALGTIWLGEDFHNIAVYMADARAQVLSLMGNGDHDWTEIFLRWSVLRQDTWIAGFTHFLGWLLMAGAVLWLFRAWRRQQT